MFNLDHFRSLVTNADATRGISTEASLPSLFPLLERTSPILPSLAGVIAELRKLDNQEKQQYKLALHYLLSEMNGAIQPNRFNWLYPNEVAGMSRFADNGNRDAAGLWLYQKDIRTVISIEANGADVTKQFTSEDRYPGVKWFSCFLDDWHAPSVDHLAAYVDKVRERLRHGGVVTHCWGGTGRTGCFLAAYLISRELIPAHLALYDIRRRYRHESVEMKAQYNVLARYADHLGARRSLPVKTEWLQSAGAGHWHAQHSDDGMRLDPGHKGDPGQRVDPNINRVMVARRGTAYTQPLYIGTNPLDPVHQVR